MYYKQKQTCMFQGFPSIVYDGSNYGDDCQPGGKYDKPRPFGQKWLASMGPQSNAFDQNEQSYAYPRLTWLESTDIKV
jgi:hypothetical protein